ncbi:7167_t:CDS:2 [Dentiscutata erythropus]|uniref:7167_t:CDS:1 n=1 Tax=Dentiscutata erythropus TaxID=1348616 RepID=A0A9N8W2L6_9GLOM|nr:7167_t:CDS:2 [Dentiscutata erythropus]
MFSKQSEIKEKFKREMLQTRPKVQRRHTTSNTKQNNEPTSEKLTRSNTVPRNKNSRSNTVHSELEDVPMLTSEPNATLHMSPPQAIHEINEGVPMQDFGQNHFDMILYTHSPKTHEHEDVLAQASGQNCVDTMSSHQTSHDLKENFPMYASRPNSVKTALHMSPSQTTHELKEGAPMIISGPDYVSAPLYTSPPEDVPMQDFGQNRFDMIIHTRSLQNNHEYKDVLAQASGPNCVDTTSSLQTIHEQGDFPIQASGPNSANTALYMSPPQATHKLNEDFPLQASGPNPVNTILHMSPYQTTHEFIEDVPTQNYADMTSQTNHGTNPIASNTLPNQVKYIVPINSIDSYNSNHNISNPYLHTSELTTSHVIDGIETIYEEDLERLKCLENFESYETNLTLDEESDVEYDLAIAYEINDAYFMKELTSNVVNQPKVV